MRSWHRTVQGERGVDICSEHTGLELPLPKLGFPSTNFIGEWVMVWQVIDPQPETDLVEVFMPLKDCGKMLNCIGGTLLDGNHIRVTDDEWQAARMALHRTRQPR